MTPQALHEALLAAVPALLAVSNDLTRSDDDRAEHKAHAAVIMAHAAAHEPRMPPPARYRGKGKAMCDEALARGCASWREHGYDTPGAARQARDRYGRWLDKHDSRAALKVAMLEFRDQGDVLTPARRAPSKQWLDGWLRAADWQSVVPAEVD
jgi:hypothetical protein